MIPIFIVTNKPIEKQITLRYLPEEFHSWVNFITSNELPEGKYTQHIVNEKLPTKRQFALDYAKKNNIPFIVMSDDDVKLFIKRNCYSFLHGKESEDPRKTVPITKEAFEYFIGTFESEYKDSVALYSMHNKPFSNFRKTRFVKYNTGNFYIIDVNAVYSSCRYDRADEFEDTHFLLDIAHNGMEIVCDSWFISDNHLNYLTQTEKRNKLARDMVQKYPNNWLLKSETPSSHAGKDLDAHYQIKLRPNKPSIDLTEFSCSE